MYACNGFIRLNLERGRSSLGHAVCRRIASFIAKSWVSVIARILEIKSNQVGFIASKWCKHDDVLYTDRGLKTSKKLLKGSHKNYECSISDTRAKF